MNSIKLIIPSAIAIALSSCASKSDQYDTANPYGPADAGNASASYQSSGPSNQTYDTPAAYEDVGSASANVNASNPNIPVPPSSTASSSKPPSPPPSHDSGGVATTHTIVKGDTLGGIARKYKVSVASIKAANGMTSDVVVLGKTLKIPAN